MNRSKVLLTGVNSFIGRHLGRALSRAGVEVIGTYRQESPVIASLRGDSPNIELIRVDLTRLSDLNKLPPCIDRVVHVAGVSEMPGVTLDDMLDVNVVGTRNMQLYALKAKAVKFIYTSSLSIYGQISATQVDETTSVIAPTPYGASKFLAESLLRATSRELPTIAIRLPGVLGHGAHRAWIPTLVEKLRRQEPISIYNPAAQFNNAVHVSDLSVFVLRLLTSCNWTGFFAFPIGAEGQLSIQQVVLTLDQELSVSPEIGQIASPGSAFKIVSDFAEQNFGYRPMHIEKMLTRYIAEVSEFALQIGKVEDEIQRTTD